MSYGLGWSPFGARQIHKADKMFTDWLYGTWSEDKLHTYEVLSNIPGISNYMDYLLDRRADSEYMARYGLDYSDIHDPRKLRQVSSGSRMVGNALNYVSKNYEKLYR